MRHHRRAAVSFGALLTMAAAGSDAQTLGTSSAAAAAPGIEEIQVTARRRAENIQDAPVTVSAFGEKLFQLQQVNNLTDLTASAPNLYATQTGGSNSAVQVFIRGVGQDSLGFNSETPIGVYFDDVYLGRVQGGLVDLLDFDRIEVLRGPQGTLYGRNSTGGAIKYVLRKPDLETSRFAGDITVGDYNRIDVRGTLSVPLVQDVLAVKIDLLDRNQDGYLDGVDQNGNKTGRTINGIDRFAGHASVLWAPTDALKIELAGDYTRDRSGATASTPLRCASPVSCAPLFGDPYRTVITVQPDGRDNSWGTSLHADLSLSDYTVRSVTAFRGFTDYGPLDLYERSPTFTLPILIGLKQHQVSEELQLLSPSDARLTFVAGFFYYHENVEQNTIFLNARRNLDDQISDSVALFGEASYAIWDGLKLTFGLRYTTDDKSATRRILSLSGAQIGAGNPTFSDSQVTPKVGLDYRITPDVLAYAIYSEGYRPGGLSETYPANSVAANGTVQSETIRNYEIGTKTEWFSHRLRINLDGYWAEYSNQQQSVLTATSFNVVSSDLRIRGIELEGQAEPIDGLLVTFALGTIDDQVTRSSIPGDNLNRKLRYAPDWSAKLGGEYRFDVTADGDQLFLGGNWTHVGRTPQDQANTPYLVQQPYDLFDAQLGLESADRRYRLTLAGKNLTDVAYFRSGVPGTGIESRFYAPPRTFTANLTVRF